MDLYGGSREIYLSVTYFKFMDVNSINCADVEALPNLRPTQSKGRSVAIKSDLLRTMYFSCSKSPILKT